MSLRPVLFFKHSGKFYTDENIEIPDDAEAWHFQKWCHAHLQGRLTGMTAVIDSPHAPWGYPALCVVTDAGARGLGPRQP